MRQRKRSKSTEKQGEKQEERQALDTEKQKVKAWLQGLKLDVCYKDLM